MSKQGTVRRYILIIEKLGRKQFPSFDEIKNYLSNHDFEVSNRTIQRDIEQIRSEFGIEIQYNRFKNGYFINEDLSLDLESFVRFFEIVNTADLLIESLKESKDTLDYISFEAQGSLKGIENLKPLLFAIKNRRVISFTHENFYEKTHSTHTVKPYLLKEYQNRWYLIGTIKPTDEFRTFGIDRISNLVVSETTFKPSKKKKASKLFEHTIGLTYSLGEVEDVVLSFTALQGKYIKTLPLHSSQRILVDNEKELQIKLKIIPNFEFQQQLLKLGDNVKVLQPQWLADEIKNVLTNTLKQYE